ncbi:MAG TPA: hypothetical protein VF796_04540 [Humisphaera sp.]
MTQGRTKPDTLGAAQGWAAAYWARRVDALLAGVGDDGRRADLRLFYEERAAVAEFDGGLARFAAERWAFELLTAAVAAERADRAPSQERACDERR